MDSILVGDILLDVQERKAQSTLQVLVQLHQDDSLETALKRLSGHKILSAPIKLDHNRYGTLDMAEIAAAIADHEDPKMILKEPAGKFCTETTQRVVEVTTPLTVAIALLASQVHRLIITDSNADSLVGVLSQMDVIRFLTKRWDLIPPMLQNTHLGDLMSKNPVTVSSKDRVADAFKKMLKFRYAGVAVVNDKGEFISNLSISDLREMAIENLQELHRSVEHYLKDTKKVIRQPITCHATDSYAHAIKLMSQSHIHRVYIVDVNNAPIGVYSACDVLMHLDSALGRQ